MLGKVLQKTCLKVMRYANKKTIEWRPRRVEAEEMRKAALAWVDIIEERYSTNQYAPAIEVLPGLRRDGSPGQISFDFSGQLASAILTIVADSEGISSMEKDLFHLAIGVLGHMALWTRREPMEKRPKVLDPVRLLREIELLFGVEVPVPNTLPYTVTCADLRRVFESLKPVSLRRGTWTDSST